MKKTVVAILAAVAFATPALAGHNPTPPEGYKNYGQCVSALVKEQNEVRKTPEAYTEAMAADINGAECERRADGAFAIVF